MELDDLLNCVLLHENEFDKIIIYHKKYMNTDSFYKSIKVDSKKAL